MRTSTPCLHCRKPAVVREHTYHHLQGTYCRARNPVDQRSGNRSTISIVDVPFSSHTGAPFLTAQTTTLSRISQSMFLVWYSVMPPDIEGGTRWVIYLPTAARHTIVQSIVHNPFLGNVEGRRPRVMEEASLLQHTI